MKLDMNKETLIKEYKESKLVLYTQTDIRLSTKKEFPWREFFRREGILASKTGLRGSAGGLHTDDITPRREADVEFCKANSSLERISDGTLLKVIPFTE